MINNIFAKNCISISVVLTLTAFVPTHSSIAQIPEPNPKPSEATPNNLTLNPVVGFEVDRSGKAINITIVKSSGDKELDAAAISLVEQWQFDPNATQPLETYTATVNLDLDQNVSGNQYPAVIVDSFVEGCTKGNAAYEPMCQCTIDNIQENLSIEEFTEISLAIQENPEGETAQQFEPILTQAFIACIDQAPEELLQPE